MLGRKSVLMGILTSGFVVANAARPSDAIASGTVKPIAVTQPTSAPTWTTNTAYALGQQVISPNNDVVSAKVAHTSSASYASDTLKWALSATYLTQALGVAKGTLVLNVKDYGAVGNGTTDDTAAVQNAITAAATSSPGSLVYFPAGSYLVSGLSLPSGVTLQGVSGQQFGPRFGIPNTSTVSRLLLKTGSSNAILSPNDGGSQPATSVTICNLMLDCNGVAQSAINIPDRGTFITRWWTMERCYVTGMSGSTGYAVYIGQNDGGCLMRDVTVFNGTSGSAAGPNGVGWYGQDGVIEKGSIGWWGGSGVVALGGSSDGNLRIVDTDIYTNGASGLVVGGGGVTVLSTSIDHNQQNGVYLANGPATFIGCVFHTNSQVGNGSNSNITLGANDLQVRLIGCRAFVDGGVTNLPKYMVNCGAYTGIDLVETGNVFEGSMASNFTTGWSNHAGPQRTSYIGTSLQGTGTAVNLTSLTLPAGSWLLLGVVGYYTSSSTDQILAWIGPTSGAQTSAYTNEQLQNVSNGALSLMWPITLASQTTVYLEFKAPSTTWALTTSTGAGLSTGLTAVPIGAT